MKHHILALALILLLLGAYVTVSIAPPKHVNPAFVSERPPLGINVITIYRLTIALASTMNFSEALLKVKEMEEAYMPREFSYAYKKLASLMGECISHIERASNLTDKAEKLISEGKYFEAEKSLNTAEESLKRAERIIDDILEASRPLSRIIPQKDIASETSKLRDLIASLRERISKLREQLRAQLMEAVETRISIKVSPLSASPGQTLTVEGELREASEAPIAGRRVTVIAGSSKVMALTDGFGRFNVKLKVVDYVRVVEVKALYAPEGADRYLYKPSVSEPVPVEVLFYTPKLRAELRPDKATPGGVVEVTVETEPGAKVKIVAFNETLVEVGAGGLATVELLVPEDAKPGEYNVTVRVLPEGVRGPAGQRLTLTVYKMPLHVNIEFPERVLAGSRVPIKVTAQADSIITVCIEGVACERVTGASVLVEPQIPITARDHVDITVKADPINPAYTSTEKSFRVNVVNWLSTILSITLLVAAIALIAFPAFKLAPAMIRKPAAERMAEGPGGVTSVEPRAGGDIVKYLIDLVIMLTGVGMLASYTLREFLLEVKSRAPWVYEVIRKPIMLLERALYGKTIQTIWSDVVREASEALEKLRRAGKG